MSETAGIPVEELLARTSQGTLNAPEQTPPALAESAAVKAPVAPATDAEDHATYDPTTEDSLAQQAKLEAARQAEQDIVAMSKIADQCLLKRGVVYELGHQLFVLSLLRRSDSASNPQLLIQIAELLDSVHVTRDDQAALADFPGGVQALDSITQTATKWQQEMVASAKGILVREANAVGQDADLNSRLHSLTLASSEAEVVGVAQALHEALSVAPTIPGGTPATERASIILRQMYPHLEQQLLAISAGGRSEEVDGAEKPAETREEEMNRIATALGTELDKIPGEGGKKALIPEEIKDITEAVKKAGNDNPQLTQGDLRVEALKALRAVVNARPNKGDRMTSWDAARYTNFTKAETQALNAVFGAKTHDARLGIVYPDGHVVKPDKDYRTWVADVEKLQKVDDPSARFNPPESTSDGGASGNPQETQVQEQLRANDKVIKFFASFTPELWKMTEELTASGSSTKFIEALATVLKTHDLPKDEKESLELRVAFLNEAFPDPENREFLAEYINLSQDIQPEMASNWAAETTQWVDAVFGSTDEPIGLDENKKFVAQKTEAWVQEKFRRASELRRLHASLWGSFLGRDYVFRKSDKYVGFPESVAGRVSTLSETWKPGQPQPFQVTRDVTPEQAAAMISS